MKDLILDNTMLQAWDACPTRYYWRHLRGIVLQDDNAAPLNFGIALHRALETYYKGGTQDESLRAFLAFWQSFTPDGYYTAENGVTILDNYFKKWGSPEQWTVKHVEVNLQWELSSDLVYCGRVDLIVEWNNDLYVVDHKSSQRISAFCDRPNHQFSGYTYGTRTLGTPTVGAIINLLAVLSPNTKIPTDQRFRRVISPRTPFELEDWRLHVLNTREEIHRAVEGGRFERKTSQCNWCPYKPLCNSAPEVVEAVAGSLYKIQPWEPWKEAGED